MKLNNQETKVLNAVCFLQEPTRTAIAVHAGISTVSAAAILEKLSREGIIKTAGTVKGQGGRPSVLYSLNESLGYSVGVSINEGVSRIASTDMAGNVVDEHKFIITLSEKNSEHVSEIVRQTAQELKNFLKKKGNRQSRMMGLCVALPGMVDSKKGVWLHGLQVSGIEHIPLGDMLEKKIGFPVMIEDKSRCLAFYEMSKPGNVKTDDSAFLYLGEGIGTGLTFDGELYYGARGLAGEIGHLTAEQDGSRCVCGNTGCLETILSASAIIKRFRKRLEEGVKSSLQLIDTGGLDLDHILEAAKNNDRLALNTLFETGGYVGDACSTIIQMFNPQRLTVGGPVAVLSAFFKDAAMQRIKQRVIPEMLCGMEIDFAVSGEWDEALGACFIAKDNAIKKIGTLLDGLNRQQ